MIEFAIVVILLITLLYGIIAFGLILSAPATVTLAAADVVRAGGVASLSAVSTAQAQATTDTGWMDMGTPSKADAADRGTDCGGGLVGA